MKILRNCLFLLMCFLLVGVVGCQSAADTAVSDLMTPALALGGSAAGLYATKDDGVGTQMAATAGGGVIGWLSGMFLKKGVEDEKVKQFRTGYELGQSNATKALYWDIQALHKVQDDEQGQKMIYYQLPVQYADDGINRTPGSIMMPVVAK